MVKGGCGGGDGCVWELQLKAVGDDGLSSAETGDC